jgi:tetratricopeptide (TPR) repeat protein
MGRLYYFNENYPEALSAFEKYASLKPGSIEGETYIAKVLYGQQKYDEALSKLAEIITTNPEDDLSSAYKYTAYVYNDKEEYAKALDNFNKVPKNMFETEDYVKLAQIYVNTKDYGNAYRNFNLALEADSTDDNIFYNMGIAQFNEKKYDDAVVSFDRAIELGSRQLAAYVYKGLSYYSLQKYEEAISTFDAANRIDNSYVQSWLWKARSEVALDKLDEAKASYTRVLELDPNNQGAQDDMKLIDQKQ